MRQIRLRRDEKGTAARMEEFIARIEAFSLTYQGNPQALIEIAWAGFASNDPGVYLVAVLNDDDDEMIGHSIAQIRQWGKHHVGWIYQCEVDIWSNAAVRNAYNLGLEQWCETWNAMCQRNGRPDMIVTELRLQTPHDPRIMTRLSGFTLDAHLMRRPLTGLSGGEYGRT